MHRPKLVRHARYRFDALRQQHQLVFPEGVLVLNESAAAIVRLCDGRTSAELRVALRDSFVGAAPAEEVDDFLQRLAEKGLVRDSDT
jgi:coenzyme PQQ biosynthesis protein PqqD